MRIDAVLEQARNELAAVSESPRLDAELLLCQCIDVARSYLFAHPDDELDALALERLARLLKRRIAGEPMAYIGGEKEFWSQSLAVSPATLIPRPETERLVELALSRIPRRVAWTLLDLGTGSGAIAIALAGERPLCHVIATDISAAALDVASQNARAANLPNIEFRLGDWTEPVDGIRFDLIVSNPPYVSADDPALDKLSHEPREALVAGADGLDAVRILARDCRRLLDTGNCLLLEHGAGQENDVAAILTANGWTDIASHNDLAGRPRVTEARRGVTQAPSHNNTEQSADHS